MAREIARSAGRGGALALAGDNLRIAIPFPASGKVENPHFFAATENAVAYAAPQSFSRKGDMLIVTIKRAGQGALKELSGVLRLNGAGDGVEVVASEGVVPADGTPIATSDEKAPELPALPWLILAALAGGLLLNIMPCVFPILSPQGAVAGPRGRIEAEARAEGIFYSAGVIVACTILGALLLPCARRATGGLGVPVAGTGRGGSLADAGRGDHGQSAGPV
jgi:thiol:disulfide interchange protein